LEDQSIANLSTISQNPFVTSFQPSLNSSDPFEQRVAQFLFSGNVKKPEALCLNHSDEAALDDPSTTDHPVDPLRATWSGEGPVSTKRSRAPEIGAQPKSGVRLRQVPPGLDRVDHLKFSTEKVAHPFDMPSNVPEDLQTILRDNARATPEEVNQQRAEAMAYLFHRASELELKNRERLVAQDPRIQQVLRKS